MQDKTILFAEDNPMVADIAQFVLKRLGFTVLYSDRTEPALRMLADTAKIDLLFTDVLLADGDIGTDIANAALEKYHNLPFLFSSGYTNSNIPAELLARSNIAFLQKPYTASQLTSAIEQLVPSGA